MRGEFIANLVIHIFILVTIILTYTLPVSSPQGGGDIGAYAYPQLIAYIALILNLLVTINLLRNKSVSTKNKKHLLDKNYSTTTLLLSLLVGYVAILPWVGYKMSTGILILLLMLLFKIREYKLLIFIPVGMVLVLYVIFENLLRVPLP